MKLYLSVTKYSFLWFMTYKSEFIADILKRILQIVFMVMFWNLVIKENESLVSLEKLISYFIVVAAISDFIMIERLDFGKFISQNIKHGTLNNILIKPVNVTKYLYAYTLGDRLSNLLFAFASIVIAVLITPPSSILHILLSVVFLLLAIAIGLAINIFVGLLSFYLVETHHINLLIQYIVRVISGAFVPLYFYTESAQKILNLTPFPSLVFRPIDTLFAQKADSNTFEYLIIGIIWAIVLNIIVYFLWKYSLKKYEAIGI